MRQFEIRLHPDALVDLHACAAWFDSPSRGQAWLQRMWQEIQALETLPHLPAPMRLDSYPAHVRRAIEALPYQVRQKTVDQHYVRFVVDEERDRVVILRIWPARRTDRPDLTLPPDLSDLDP